VRVLLIAIVWVLAASARAEPCGPLDDPARIDQWPDAPEVAAFARDLDGSWATARGALARFVTALRDRTDVPSQKLVARARRVLADYDGTEERARFLAVDEVTPKRCGDIEVDDLLVPACAWSVLSDDEAIRMPTTGACDDKRKVGGQVKVLRAIVASVHGVHVEDAALTLEHHTVAWQRLITRGFSQYPWEVLLHGAWLPPTAWGPSEHQLIVAHPSVGFGVEDVSGDARAAAAIAIEAAGWLYYFRDFRQYAGVSVAASISNLDFKRWSLGPVAHLSGLGLGYGMAVRGAREHTVFLLIDVSSALDDGLLENLARRATTH
jgi:hypothetical protein